jgi:hypothetical protein
MDDQKDYTSAQDGSPSPAGRNARSIKFNASDGHTMEIGEGDSDDNASNSEEGK